jgi:hypothetical protein
MSFSSTTPMQVASALKKRTPFAFASDEDNSPADATILDDQGKSSSSTFARSIQQQRFRAGRGNTDTEGGE